MTDVFVNLYWDSYKQTIVAGFPTLQTTKPSHMKHFQFVGTHKFEASMYEIREMGLESELLRRN